MIAAESSTLNAASLALLALQGVFMVVWVLVIAFEAVLREQEDGLQLRRHSRPAGRGGRQG